jgi:hypothetical protein
MKQQKKSKLEAGRMTREEAMEMAKQYDDYNCLYFWDKLADYYKMTPFELRQICDSWANTDIVEPGEDRWVLRKELRDFPTIENAIEIDYDGSY